MLILTSGFFRPFDEDSTFWTSFEIPSSFEESMNHLFEKIRGFKNRNTYDVFWEKNDYYDKEGRPLSDVVKDLLNLLNQTIYLLSMFCDPKLSIFNEFKIPVYQLVVKNFDPDFLYPNFPPMIVDEIAYFYGTIKYELEKEEYLKQSNEAKKKEISEKLQKAEKTKVNEVEEKSELEKIKEETKSEKLEANKHDELEKINLTSIPSEKLHKEESILQKSTESNLNKSTESNLKKSTESSLKKSTDSDNKFIKIFCMAAHKKYSFSYLDNFSVKIFSKKRGDQNFETESEYKNPNFSTIYDYIFSVYCLLPTKSQEICKTMAANLKALDESEFDRYCKVKAKNLSQKSDLLRKFFGKNNVEVWDIYQLEKNFDNLENNKINEVDKIIETGKSNDLNQDVKEFLDENEKIN